MSKYNITIEGRAVIDNIMNDVRGSTNGGSKLDDIEENVKDYVTEDVT